VRALQQKVVPSFQTNARVAVVDDLNGDVREAELLERAHAIRAIEEHEPISARFRDDRRVPEPRFLTKAIHQAQRPAPLRMLVEEHELGIDQLEMRNSVGVHHRLLRRE
jgi:hypothetical protein